MKKKVIAIPADVWACGKYRIIDPFVKLSQLSFPDFEFEVFDPEDGNTYTVQTLAAMLLNYDAIVFQRVADYKLLAIMQSLKKMGKKIFMDIDDDLLNVATTSPAHSVWKRGGESLKVFCEALRVCDAVFVSTPELSEAYKDFNKNFVVFPNAIDTKSSNFYPENSRRGELDPDKTYVMWTGSSTHFDSLQVISNCLKSVFDARPNAVFSLCSNPEFLDLFSINPEQKLYIPHVTIDKYYNIPSMADVGLAPVQLNKFNDGKSELKCLEYGIWGIPTICSPAAPYVRFNEVSLGANILVKKNKPQEWMKNVAKLIDDVELRKSMGHNAKNTVKKYYDLSVTSFERYSYFQKALN